MTAIILDESHSEKVVNLLTSRQKFSKQDNQGSILDTLTNGSVGYLGDRGTHRIIGSFEGEDLQAILCQSFSTRIPIWVMDYYATHKNSINLGKGYGKYLEDCFELANREAEGRGIFDFWWSVPRLYAKNGPRLQQTSPNWIRYEVYTDAVIPANTFPTYEIHKQAYGITRKPHDVFIRHAVLKQEYRKVPLTR